MKARLITICLCALAVSSILAQETESAVIPPTPQGNGHILETSVNNPKDVPVRCAAYRSGDFSERGEQEVTESVPDAVADKLPTTMTVRTATLLELHSMRKSAVELCIQLPTKYRTRLPECSDIFKHEIRLETLAKDRK